MFDVRAIVSAPWEQCEMEGHAWKGRSVCSRCGERLRCICGRFIREDNQAHFETCTVVATWSALFDGCRRSLVLPYTGDWIECGQAGELCSDCLSQINGFLDIVKPEPWERTA